MSLFSTSDRASLMGRVQMAVMDAGLREALFDLVDKFDSLTSLTAALTGNVTGNLTGNVTGNVAGNIVGRLTVGVSTPTIDGVADMTKGLFILDGTSTGIDLTGFTPAAAGQIAVVWCTDSTTDCSVTCGSGVTFDGSNNKAVFADAGDALVLIAASATRWLVLVNLGSVALSSV